MNSVPVDGIVRLASRLVATPSCGGIDSPEAVLRLAFSWLDDNRLKPRLLHDAEGKPVAVTVEISGSAPGPAICLDACIDSAPVGDIAQWRASPFSGAVEGGRLWGRGAADSKAGVAIIAHVAKCLAETKIPRGTVHVLFDADEHTGRFGGVREFVKAVPRLPDAVALGYPGNDCIVVGSRGFLRVKVRFAGRSAHSGEIARTGINALTKAACFSLTIAEAEIAAPHDERFPFGPAATVTRIEGGEGFSQVPDLAICDLDVRLTRTFDATRAMAWLEGIVQSVDARIPSGLASRIETVDHWPAYLVDTDHPLVRSFAQAAEGSFSRRIGTDVCGPSNIGNFLAAQGVPTICAPGVGFGNIHAANEWADVASIASVYSMYCDAVRRFLVAC